MADVLPDAVVADYGGVSAPDWYEGVARRVAAQCDGRPWIAVLHSGAGGFAPTLAAAAKDLAGIIFVDAVLPYPGKSYLENAPADLAAQLRRLTRDGYLAPWNAWFEIDPTPRLIPDSAARDLFVKDLPRVPFAFLEEVSRADSDWERLPAAYVQLSKIYEDTADKHNLVRLRFRWIPVCDHHRHDYPRRKSSNAVECPTE
jgi:hypothetical protein